MTTISAAAASGLLVALMAAATSDAAPVKPAAEQARNVVHPGDIRGFNPQPDPPRERAGDGSLRPAGQ